jgi:hypothetical protein
MPTVSFEYRSQAERIAMERAVAFVAEMHALAQTAPDGQILPTCEAHALDAGRDLLRTTLIGSLQKPSGQKPRLNERKQAFFV